MAETCASPGNGSAFPGNRRFEHLVRCRALHQRIEYCSDWLILCLWRGYQGLQTAPITQQLGRIQADPKENQGLSGGSDGARNCNARNGQHCAAGKPLKLLHLVTVHNSPLLRIGHGIGHGAGMIVSTIATVCLALPVCSVVFVASLWKTLTAIVNTHSARSFPMRTPSRFHPAFCVPAPKPRHPRHDPGDSGWSSDGPQ